MILLTLRGLPLELGLMDTSLTRADVKLRYVLLGPVASSVIALIVLRSLESNLKRNSVPSAAVRGTPPVRV